jgi:hypothetical protein
MTVRLVLRWKAPNPPAVCDSPAATEAAQNHRFYDRLPVKYRFSIYADNQQSGQRSMVARGLDMSKAGALVEADEPISVGTVVYIKAGEVGLMGTATVRHCTVRGSKFRIGLHFPSPLMRCL